MLSPNDYMEKQIIVISAETYKALNLINDNLAIKEKWKITNQVPCSKVFCVFVVWNITLSTKLVNRLLEYQISIYCMNFNFKPLFVIGKWLQWNYILRQKQYDKQDELETAKKLINNKINNQLSLINTIRNKDEKLKDNIQKFKMLLDNIPHCVSDDNLRGVEWNASKLFFQVYFQEIGWYKRMPRTRIDITNFLMDMGYTYLFNFIEANLNLYWFDIYKGFYHRFFYERKSLVCDIIEPFRSIIDKKIRKMYNLSQINKKDFKFKNWEYFLPWKSAKPYTKHILETILENKREIFDYVKQFYRYMMRDDEEFPVFNI